MRWVARSCRVLFFTESSHQIFAKLFACEFALCITMLSVQDVCVDHSNLHYPKKHLPPPSNRLSHEVVVSHSFGMPIKAFISDMVMSFQFLKRERRLGGTAPSAVAA